MPRREPQKKLLAMYVAPGLYRRLDQVAQARDREVNQQAIHYIRRGLERDACAEQSATGDQP
jgi:hypothetical protein